MPSPGRGSVYSATIKPSTRSARSISVNSVLRLWRHGGRREPPIGCGPRPHCVLPPLPLRERGRVGRGVLTGHCADPRRREVSSKKEKATGCGGLGRQKKSRPATFAIAVRSYSPPGLAGAAPAFLLLPAL